MLFWETNKIAWEGHLFLFAFAKEDSGVMGRPAAIWLQILTLSGPCTFTLPLHFTTVAQESCTF